MTQFPALAVLALALCLPSLAAAQPAPAQAPAADLSLEQLLETEVISSASKFRQEVREAPAAITVVTSEDIRRHGHRTLADVLRSVRGFYTTYDRNYSYIGVRGFSRPGDYNTRVLLLVDGHRMNDAVYDMAPIGTDFPIAVSLIDRVEVIRGPGSSLYGTSAFFAVINVITRTGGEHAGARAEASGGSLGTTGATFSYGTVLGSNRELLLGASAQRAGGAGRLRFPEIADEGGAAEAVGLDHDGSASVFGSFAAGAFAIRGGIGSRHKQVPTAAFDTVFGDDRFATTDTRGSLNLTYDGAVGRGWSGTARVAYDYYGYGGDYPYDYGLPEVLLQLDRSESQTASSEITLRRHLSGGHLFTVGAEVRRQFRSRQWAEDNSGLLLDIQRPGTVVGVYVQDEMRVRPWLIVNAGTRVDRYPSFGTYATPRVGVVVLPRRSTAIKLLYGRAFRAPNPYELYYYAAMEADSQALSPEKIHSTELVWEESFSSRLRTSVSAFTYDASDLIELGSAAGPDGSSNLVFSNAGDVEAVGIEGEIDARLPGGASLRFSHAAVRTRHEATGAAVSNSPRHTSKAGVQVPLARLMAGFEGQYVGERLTIGGEPLPGFFVSNLTLTSPLGRGLELALGVYNAFDARYADPGAEEHRQASIPQDGRTVMARVRVGV